MANKLASEYRVSSSMGSPTIQTLSANSSVTNWNYTVKADATTAQFTATLPTAIGNDGKQIEIIKTDNSNNSVVVVPFPGQSINGSVDSIYLYNQNDSVVIRSDGVNSYIVADNRNSTGSSISYLKARTSVAGVSVANNTNFIFNTVEYIYGNKISINTTNGQITLKAGSTYKLTASGVYAATGYWRTSWLANGAEIVGSQGQAEGQAYGSDATNIVVVSPVSDTIYEYRNITGSTYTFGALGLYPWVYVEEISRQATVINTVDYLFARPSGEVTTVNTTIPVTTALVGNIPIVNNMFNLQAGKTFELEACMEFRGADGSVWAEYIWTDGSGVQLPSSNIGISVPAQSSATDSESLTKAIITPSQDMSVKVMTTNIVSNITGLAPTRSYFKITQIGSTAQTLNSGTEAQRIAMSPTVGYEFYQTDNGDGKYIYSGGKWDKISNKAYLKASNVVSVNPSANTLLNFSSGVVLNGIKTNMGGGKYELYPGVYELMGVQLLNENDAGISYQFYNYTTSSYIGEKGNAADVIGSAGTGSPAFSILECTVDTQIGLRCTNDSATVTATEGNWLKIVQIS